MAKRGRLVRLLDNEGYEDIPVGALGIVVEWVEARGRPARGGLYTVYFPVEQLETETRLMFVDRFETVGEVPHG